MLRSTLDGIAGVVVAAVQEYAMERTPQTC